MRNAVLKLEMLGDEARRQFERGHWHRGWFRDWDAMPEHIQTPEDADDEDTTLWHDYTGDRFET